ncbi:cation acetate symporter [Mycobacterium sp. MBM]|nr:cation acetate symporter [Mycobacterium sp. MBM]
MSASTVVFIGIIVLLLGVAGYASRRVHGKESLLVGNGVSSTSNGLAITGEFASVATFLGLVGGVSLYGFGGMISVLGVPLGFLVLLILIAGPLRAGGRFTVSDVLTFESGSARLRKLVGLTGLVISSIYMIGQFVGGAGLIGALFGLDFRVAVALVGGLTLVMVVMGGMASATAVQVLKTCLLMAASVTILLLALAHTSWNPFDVLGEARTEYGDEIGGTQSASAVQNFDRFSATVATVFGIAGMPHLMVRLLTVRSAREARRSALLAVWLMSAYLLVMTLVGFAASILVGRSAISESNAGGNTATILLAETLGGEVFGAVIAGLVFAIIAAVLAGLLVSMMGNISHDLFNRRDDGEGAGSADSMRVARIGAVVVTVVASLLAVGAQDVNLIFVGTFAFGVAASTIFPVLVFRLYYSRTTASGAVAGVVVGLGSSVLLLLCGPIVLGEAALFPYSQPAVITIPIAFLTVWLVSRAGARRSVVGSAR